MKLFFGVTFFFFFNNQLLKTRFKKEMGVSIPICLKGKYNYKAEGEAKARRFSVPVADYVAYGLMFWEAVGCVLGNFKQVCALCVVKQIGKASRENSCLHPRICYNTA